MGVVTREHRYRQWRKDGAAVLNMELFSDQGKSEKRAQCQVSSQYWTGEL